MSLSNPPYKIALNGYGRIGRAVLRALYESKHAQRLEIVALNDPATPQSIAHLTRYDSTHGRFNAEVALVDQQLLINRGAIKLIQKTIPQEVDWNALGIDLLLECTGHYKTRTEAEYFLHAGAPRVLFSQPMQQASAIDATIIFGVNQSLLQGNEQLVSNGSCTTNCAVPVLKLLHENLGIEHALITSIHSAMNDQPILDNHHVDLTYSRAAFHSVIPVSTELARGLERLLPELTGRIQAKALRVPVMNVSCLEITCQVRKDTNKETLNDLLKTAASSTHLSGLISYTQLPHASCDFNHDAHSAIIDSTQTLVVGSKLVSLLVWFDNEWGFANRMLDVACHWLDQATHLSSSN